MACGLDSHARSTFGCLAARGKATVFIPCDAEVRSIGRVVALVVPAVEFATVVHKGAHANIDLTYASLAAYVARCELAVEGPLRENYLMGSQVTPEMSNGRTEIGWPIFQTAAYSGSNVDHSCIKRAVVGSCGGVFCTKIARGSNPRTQRLDPKAVVAAERYFSTPIDRSIPSHR